MISGRWAWVSEKGFADILLRQHKEDMPTEAAARKERFIAAYASSIEKGAEPACGLPPRPEKEVDVVCLDLSELFTSLDQLLAEHALLRRSALLFEKAQPIVLSRTGRELDLRGLMHIAAIAHGMLEIRWVQPGFEQLAGAKLEIRALGVDG